MTTSRRGQQIARKACDGCRDRKIKCTWADGAESESRCDGCMTAEIYCTFQMTRKRRGRPQRDLERFRQTQVVQNDLPSPRLHHQTLPLNTQVAIEHFCPIQIFHQIIEDFLHDLYPIAPLIHVPSFNFQIQESLYQTDPKFLRLCLSLCAMTIASLPRKANIYRFGHYTSTKGMVNRACVLVTASRLATSPDWAETPSVNDLICSLFLGMASHYAQCPRQGWILINESNHCCRSLNLCHQDGYRDLDAVQAEICKRAFWMLYIVQIHDRISHPEPYTLIGEIPSSADWDFLLPISVSDNELGTASLNALEVTTTPSIAGFVTLVRVFRCLRGLLSVHVTNTFFQPNSQTQQSHFLSPASLLATFTALSSALDDIPPELNILEFQRHPDQQTRESNHFNIMKSNIYITKLYLQCWILDRYLSILPPVTSPQSPTSTRSEAQRLRSYRQDITRQALQVLKFSSQNTLESHGESMVIKIREIATSLLEQEQENAGSQTTVDGQDGDLRSETDESGAGGGNDCVMASFLHILAALDYAHRQAVDI
ncbi:hypothetical protein ONS95_014660 [Cadophora gregata]|uniref:uncharacterized protein n=1 Tax=Cadophora gregata TaxID=51156 RepID=UPI0026DAA656|nr:uncharacterized protein ONS95_014660 [Cadophora gregata]KAK0112942.1 hypothetical protein ONS95_014660 [Cadophora gregata]KAK0125066.1 hypothetical protein ONS96_008934 [Cadophora gregata f. sp. sojae]